MPKRIQANFDKGMVTDVTEGQDSLARLHNAYISRSGEISTIGSMGNGEKTFSIPAGAYSAGYADAAFHPNFGCGVVRGVNALASKNLNSSGTYFQLVGMPLIDDNVFPASYLNPAYTADTVTSGANSDTIRLDHASQTMPFEKCLQHAVAPNEIVYAGEFGNLFKWGGSSGADYTTGTVSTTAGSRRIEGAGGTAWSTNVEEGMYILIDGVGEKATNGEQRAFRITYVEDNDTLEVDYPMIGTLAGKSYRIVAAAVIQAPPGVWNPDTDRPTSVGVCCYHQGRLFVAGTSDADTDYSTVYNFDRLRWSGNASDVMVDPANESGFHHMDLWRSGAFIDVDPGRGGAIRGLVSMGDELVIIKSHAIFRLTGDVALSGGTNNLNVKVSLIADGIGANGFKGFAMTKRGLVIASQDGLYLYDGEKVTSLTGGRMQKWWDANFSTFQFAVIAFDDKVIVSPWLPNTNNYSATYFWGSLVWAIDKDYFFTMGMYPAAAGCAVFTATDRFANELLLPQYYSAQNKLGFGWARAMMEIENFTLGIAGIPFNTSSNRGPDIVTHPFPLGSDEVTEGRVNNVLMHSFFTLENSDNLEVSLIDGSKSNDDFVYLNQSTVLEYEAAAAAPPSTSPARPSTRAYRSTVDSHGPVPSARVRIKSSSDGSAEFKLYAIGVDYTESEVVGP